MSSIFFAFSAQTVLSTPLSPEQMRRTWFLSFSSANISVMSKLSALLRDKRKSPLHDLSSLLSHPLTDSKITANTSAGTSDLLKMDSTEVRGMFLMYFNRVALSDFKVFKSASSAVTDLGTP